MFAFYMSVRGLLYAHFCTQFTRSRVQINMDCRPADHGLSSADYFCRATVVDRGVKCGVKSANQQLIGNCRYVGLYSLFNFNKTSEFIRSMHISASG